jgi:hypothetical protein
MTYLTQQRKEELADPKQMFVSPADLTYGLTVVAMSGKLGASFIGALDEAIARYLGKSEPRFEDFAVIMGCLSCTSREMLRRRPNSARADIIAKMVGTYADAFYSEHIAPYEDIKINQNGDVY